MRTTLCLIFAFALTACGGSDPAPAPAPEQPAAEKPAAEAAPEPAAAEAAVEGEAAAEGAVAAEGDAAAEGEAAPEAAAGGNAEAGKATYNTFCLACHQADGTGMGGVLAADFVNDKARLAKSDADLLASIENGVAGTTMIAWGGQLDETKRKDVLAYIRATYGK